MDGDVELTTKKEVKMRLDCSNYEKICACQKVVCCKKVKRAVRQRQKMESRLLARLCALLRRMPSVQRRTVLQVRLAEGQRLALERWMLSHRSFQSHSNFGNVQGEIETFSEGHCQLDKFVSRSADVRQPDIVRTSSAMRTAFPDADSKPMRPRGIARKRKIVDAPLARKNNVCSPAEAEAEATHTSVGVMCNMQKGGCYYSAQLSIGSLRLMSKADRDLNTVLLFRDVLVAIRQRSLPVSALSKADYANYTCFEKRFRDAVFDTLSEWNLDAASMGLRFKVCVRPLWISRPLCTPTYTIANHLDEGLRALRRLHAARSGVQRRSHVLRVKTLKELTDEWSGLREAYMEIMMDAGRHRPKVQATLDHLHSEFLGRARTVAHEKPPEISQRQGCIDRLDRQRTTNRLSRLEHKLEGLLRRWACLEGRVPGKILRHRSLVAMRACKMCRFDVLAQQTQRQ